MCQPVQCWPSKGSGPSLPGPTACPARSTHRPHTPPPPARPAGGTASSSLRSSAVGRAGECGRQKFVQRAGQRGAQCVRVRGPAATAAKCTAQQQFVVQPTRGFLCCYHVEAAHADAAQLVPVHQAAGIEAEAERRAGVRQVGAKPRASQEPTMRAASHCCSTLSSVKRQEHFSGRTWLHIWT